MPRTWIQNVPLVVAAIGLFVAGCEQGGPPASDAARASGSSDAAAKVQPPQPEIKLNVVGVDGYEQLVKKYRGKVVFVDFWATW